MKRYLMLMLVVVLVIAWPLYRIVITKATGEVPSDCSGELTSTDIANMANMYMADDNTDENWTACASSISETNADLLATYLEGINYAPTFVPDPSPTPGSGMFGGQSLDSSGVKKNCVTGRHIAFGEGRG